MILQQRQVQIAESKAQDPHSELNLHQLWKLQIKNKRVIEWYINSTTIQLIIQPVSIIVPSQSCKSLKLLFGHDPNKQKPFAQTYIKDLSEINCRQIGLRVLEFSSLNIYTKISMQNIFKVGTKLKLLVTDSQLLQEQYVMQFTSILKLIWQGNHKLLNFLQHFKPKNASQLLQLRQAISGRLQTAYSIENVIEKQKNIKFNIPSIEFTEQQTIWILEIINFGGHKIKQIYKGTQNGYSLQPFHTAINSKPHLLYYLQSETGQKVIFYCAVPYKQDKSSIFGSYISDTNRQSKLLSLNNKTSHILRKNINPKIKGNKAVGFGKQCLLCIGQADIVLSVGNLTNICYFPISYAPDDENVTNSADKLIGGQLFILKQLLVFQITKQNQTN